MGFTIDMSGVKQLEFSSDHYLRGTNHEIATRLALLVVKINLEPVHDQIDQVRYPKLTI